MTATRTARQPPLSPAALAVVAARARRARLAAALADEIAATLAAFRATVTSRPAVQARRGGRYRGSRGGAAARRRRDGA